MRTQRCFLSVIVPALLLLLTGCDDSKNPLSDPKRSKADESLVGVWREQSGVLYYVGHAGEKFPTNVLRVVEITHKDGQLDPPEEYLVFPTVLGDKTYLNAVSDGYQGQVKRLNEKGWKADAVDCYSFLKYQLVGDKLVVWLMDEKAKEQAIHGGKLKGVTEKDKPARFTDTTENVARFVAAAGDGLWNTKEPSQLDRVGAAKKP